MCRIGHCYSHYQYFAIGPFRLSHSDYRLVEYSTYCGGHSTVDNQSIEWAGRPSWCFGCHSDCWFGQSSVSLDLKSAWFRNFLCCFSSCCSIGFRWMFAFWSSSVGYWSRQWRLQMQVKTRKYPCSSRCSMGSADPRRNTFAAWYWLWDHPLAHFHSSYERGRHLNHYCEHGGVILLDSASASAIGILLDHQIALLIVVRLWYASLAIDSFLIYHRCFPVGHHRM